MSRAYVSAIARILRSVAWYRGTWAGPPRLSHVEPARVPAHDSATGSARIRAGMGWSEADLLGVLPRLAGSARIRAGMGWSEADPLGRPAAIGREVDVARCPDQASKNPALATVLATDARTLSAPSSSNTSTGRLRPRSVCDPLGW